MFWCFGCKACGILGPQPGIEPVLPALEDKALTTGPVFILFFNFYYYFFLDLFLKEVPR